MMKKAISQLLIPAVSLLSGTVAHAHITLERSSFEAGTWNKLVLRVAEGCNGAATTSISVELPKGVYMPRPAPKAGWKLDVKREKLDKPVETHGMQITEAIRSATWSGGSLPDDFYEEFTVFARVPTEAGKYPIKVSQICEKGRVDWHEVAKPGQSRRELKAPAPELEVIPKQ
jgi:periplasmic copper chaperone A